MHKLYELKETLCDELEKYGDRKELSAGTLDVVDKLAHTIKNLDKIIDKYEGGEDYSYDDGRIPMMSYARGRGRGAKRDSMGRYSSAGDGMVSELKELMHEAPDNMKMEFKKFIDKIERM